ncbi:hypothetical protein AYI69_g10163 [Smittium culicis]|uniref:Uncharacterized protein n=1 Tax=Smittium culicis TaxID=133412 RepID=A0A1R1X7L3_9FUNG|nr:hypothetical protein AYI69_g10163 [Smittium culicis]
MTRCCYISATSYTPPVSYTSQHRTRLRVGTCHHRTARRSPARARSTAPPSRISASRGRTAQARCRRPYQQDWSAAHLCHQFPSLLLLLLLLLVRTRTRTRICRARLLPPAAPSLAA